MVQPNKTTINRLKFPPSKIPDIKLEQLPEVSLDQSEYEILSDEKVRLTQEKATWYIDLPVFDGEREVIESHVQFLYDEMANGRFNPSAVIIATCTLDGTTYKINGQHTAWAKAFLEKYTPMVREIHYKVKTIENMKNIYASFDRGKPRSETHLVRVQLAGTPMVKGLWSRTVDKFSSALKFWVYDNTTDKARARSSEIASLVKGKYAELFKQVGIFYQNLPEADRKILDRVPITAAMLETFDAFPTIASSFWSRIADGAELSKDDARLKLRNYLLQTASYRIGTCSKKRVVDSETIYRCCINCWNKWRKGEEVDIVRPTAKRVRAR